MDILLDRRTGRAQVQSLIGRMAQAVAGVLERMVRARRERRSLRVLHGLSDRTLKDIGVTRGDVHAALYGRTPEMPVSLARRRKPAA